MDAYVHSLQDIGSMPTFHQPGEEDPFCRTKRHDFYRIPGYAGFVPGAKCKEPVDLARDGQYTERLSHLLSRSISSMHCSCVSLGTTSPCRIFSSSRRDSLLL